MARKPRKSRAESDTGRIAVFDLETDPFSYGEEPKPFAAGFYCDGEFLHFWGDRCVEHLCRHLETLEEPLLIYAHNGGKFDFFFLLNENRISNPIKIIAGRLVQAKLGIHTLRDSVAILPIALKAYKKDDIDYNKMKRGVREKHKEEILSYLKTDCVALYELVSTFIGRFGAMLTLASTAMKEIKKTEDVPRLDAGHDSEFRKFYFGGRVECFETGVIDAKIKYIDVNSMYPYVMANVNHPTGAEYTIFDENDEIPLLPDFRLDSEIDMPYFARIKCKQSGHIGAFPSRKKDGGLSFSIHEDVYYVTSHELQAAHDLGIVPDVTVLELYVPEEAVRFDDFVNKFMEEKISAEERGDKIGRLIAKLIANAGYGKFAQNPEHFFDYTIVRHGEAAPDGFELYSDYSTFEIWRKPSALKLYYDVTTAASITGAARAVLLKALYAVTRPLYCDTDSIMCTDAAAIDTHPTRIGAWDIEATGTRAAIAGKKLYALFDGKECVKLASKGLRLDAGQVVNAALGYKITWKKDAPAYSMRGLSWIERTINRDGPEPSEDVDIF